MASGEIEQMLEDKDTTVNFRALERILHLPEPDRFAYLERAVLSRNPLIGDKAVTGLTGYGLPGSRSLLIQLDRATVIIQLQIVSRLGEMRFDEATQLLLDLLARTGSTTLRHTIIRALGRIGAEKAVPAIELYLDDPDHHVRSHARAAIQAIKGEHQPL